MYIGTLEAKNISFTHEGTSVPFPPSNTDTGLGMWAWKYLYDSPIDVNLTLGQKSYVGAVTVKLNEDSVIAVEALVDGQSSGKYSAETGKRTGGEITVPVGYLGETVTVRLHTTLRDVIIESVEIVGAYDDEAPLVWPTPKNIEYLGGFTKIKDVISKNGDEDELYAVEFMKERLTEKLGDWKSERGAVIVFDKKASRSYNGERYTVKTTRGKLAVSAQSRLTLLYGADTILQLAEYKKGVRKFNCDDKPSKEFRGFHVGTPKRCQFEFMKRFYRYVLLPLRYNLVIVELAASMRYDSHPEINEAWAKVIKAYEEGKLPTPPHYDMLAKGEILEKSEIREYIGYAQELGFEVVPEVQSLGHVQYITIAHPELAEIEEKEVIVDDTRAEDARPAAVYNHCYCPSLEESYKIIFDLLDEVIELFKPKRFVHIGHDEVYQIGVCKRCREKDPSDIYAEHVTRLHDHIAEYGLRTMIWSDMIHPAPVRPYKTYKAIDKLPRDVLMLDFVWYFNLTRDIEDNLLPHKYEVAVGNLYSSHYPRYKSRVMKKGMIGGQISTWITVDEETFGNNGKMWDMMYLTEMLWNIESYDERNRRAYSEIIAKHIQPRLRDELRGKFSPAGYKSTDIKLPKGASVPAPVRSLCPKGITYGGEKIEVGAAYERLVFEHATLHTMPRIVWVPFTKIGDYVITYADGTSAEVPVRYAENIMVYDSVYGQPMPQEFYRHNGYVGTWFADPTYQGKTHCGKDLLVTGFVCENPEPEKVIATIEYRPVENDYCGLMLAGIKGLNRK